MLWNIRVLHCRRPCSAILSIPQSVYFETATAYHRSMCRCTTEPDNILRPFDTNHLWNAQINNCQSIFRGVCFAPGLVTRNKSRRYVVHLVALMPPVWIHQPRSLDMTDGSSSPATSWEWTMSNEFRAKVNLELSSGYGLDQEVLSPTNLRLRSST